MAKTFRYQHLRSTQSGTKPSASVIREGEIAVNLATNNEKIFLKNANNQVIDFIPESQIDTKISTLSGTVDTRLATKANTATTLAGYNIGDAYTKTEVDSLITSAGGDAASLVNAEKTRAMEAESALDTKISNEVTNRTNADSTLQTNINNEVSNRKAEAVASAEYNSSTQKIVFKNKNGVSLNTDIDCAAFIKDGMVSNVEIKEVAGVQCLVISFNSDSGKQDINIQLTDIFNPSNYYTKSDINNTVLTQEHVKNIINYGKQEPTEAEKQAVDADPAKKAAQPATHEELDTEKTAREQAVSNEATARNNADQTLQTNINNEASARETADQTLQTNINNEATARATAVSNEETRAKAAEQANANAITAETSARETADQTLQTNINKKQDTLVSGTNIKTVVNKSIVGSGNVEISLTDLSTSNNKDLTVDGDFIILDAGTF